jgi:hypothetical protein
MTTRQRLDHAVLTTTGQDIRLMGNWDPLPGLPGQADAVAERLQVDRQRLLRCRDIADILELLETSSVAPRPTDDGPAFF